ncbi:MAG TPA: hypothetical protein VGC06_14785, partial [Actinomycetes bacterium]
ARCFDRRAHAADPTANPPGCPQPTAGDPTGQAFSRAASSALAANFSHAVQLAAACALAAILLTFLPVLLLPRRTAPAAGEWAVGASGA